VPVRFVHTADLHLGAPFEGLCEAHEHVGHLLRDATFKALDRIVDLCVECAVDFVVIAGDVYNSSDRSLRAQLRLRDALGRLHEAGIQAYIAHGNHDPLSGWSAALDWPPNTHVFPGDRVESHCVSRAGEEICRVYGIGFAQANVTDNLARRFLRGDDAPRAVAVLHANVGGQAGHEPYAPCTLSDLSEGFDYWALGHVHSRRELRMGRSAVVYPGNPQGLSPRETGPKGCYLVTLAEGGPILEFVPTDSVRWADSQVDIAELDSLQALLERLEQVVENAREAAEGRPAVLRVALVGRGPLHREVGAEDVRADIIEQMREWGRGVEPSVWVDSVSDRTRPAVDLEARKAAQDFLGEFLRQRDEVAADLAYLEAELAELLTRREIRDLLEVGPEQLTDWLDRASVLGVDYLAGEDES
jgi:exonuclease SbcD